MVATQHKVKEQTVFCVKLKGARVWRICEVGVMRISQDVGCYILTVTERESALVGISPL